MDGRTLRREHTRRLLLDQSRTLFAARGYAAVGLAEIVARCGLTKGALYHQFATKADLFRAVAEQVQRDVADHVVTAAEAEPDAWSRLVAGCHAFLTAATAPDARQIMLIDGPAVLGWAEWRALDARTSGRHLAEALQALADGGTLAPLPVEPLTHLISGALNETALWLAESRDPSDPQAAHAALDGILSGLRAT